MFAEHLFEIIASGGAVSLSGIVGYFLKQQNSKIESVDAKLAVISESLENKIRINKQEIVNLFQDVCHERQGACQRVQTLKTDAACRKAEAVKQEQDHKWNKQDSLNDQIKAHLIKEKGER